MSTHASDHHDTLVGWGVSTVLAGVTSAELSPYLEKIVTVFLLAVVAEVGRKLVGRLWKDKK